MKRSARKTAKKSEEAFALEEEIKSEESSEEEELYSLTTVTQVSGTFPPRS
jgi:hypothetical protein